MHDLEIAQHIKNNLNWFIALIGLLLLIKGLRKN